MKRYFVQLLLIPIFCSSFMYAADHRPNRRIVYTVNMQTGTSKTFCAGDPVDPEIENTRLKDDGTLKHKSGCSNDTIEYSEGCSKEDLKLIQKLLDVAKGPATVKVKVYSAEEKASCSKVKKEKRSEKGEQEMTLTPVKTYAPMPFGEKSITSFNGEAGTFFYLGPERSQSESVLEFESDSSRTRVFLNGLLELVRQKSFGESKSSNMNILKNKHVVINDEDGLTVRAIEFGNDGNAVMVHKHGRRRKFSNQLSIVFLNTFFKRPISEVLSEQTQYAIVVDKGRVTLEDNKTKKTLKFDCDDVSSAYVDRTCKLLALGTKKGQIILRNMAGDPVHEFRTKEKDGIPIGDPISAISFSRGNYVLAAASGTEVHYFTAPGIIAGLAKGLINLKQKE